MQLREFQKSKNLVNSFKVILSQPIWSDVLSVLHSEHPTRLPIPSKDPADAIARAWMSEGYEMALRVLNGLTEQPKPTLDQIKSTYGAKNERRK